MWINYLGVSLEVVEIEVIEILEVEINGVEGVKILIFSIREGLSFINVEFKFSCDIEVVV